MQYILIALAILAGWALFVLAFPARACGACLRHRGPCPVCKGSGRRFRPGARIVHAGAVLAYEIVRRKRRAR